VCKLTSCSCQLLQRERERERESEALPEQKLVFNGALKRSINMRKKAENKKQAK